MSRYGWVSAIAIGALLLCAAPVHAQLVTNGTLDTDAAGWTFGFGCADVAWDGANGNPPGSIRLNSCGEANSDPYASQVINGLVVGNTYTINVDVRLHVNASGGGTGKSFGIFLDSQPGNPLLFAEFLDASWHTVTTSFVASSSSATIFFAAELDARTPGGPGATTDVSYYIDNISVVANRVRTPANVPTVSEWALVLLAIALAGSAGLAFRRRRRT